MLSEAVTVEDKSYNPLIGTYRCRLGECEVCGAREARYTCPACQVKTCSLTCVKLHKKELDCTGLRNRVQFKQLVQFTDMDLQNDYMLLEEMGRSVERVVKGRRPMQKNLAHKWQKLKAHLWKRGTQLQLLPPKFTRHLYNTSYLNWQTGVVYWKLEWLFPQAASASDQPLIDRRVDETCLVSDVLRTHLEAGNAGPLPSERLKPYRDAGGVEAVKVLMKAERVSADGGVKYLLISPGLSLSENLQGKLIIEHPTLHVVLSSHIHLYHILPPESVRLNDETRSGRYHSAPMTSRGSMKFFSDNLSDSDST